MKTNILDRFNFWSNAQVYQMRRTAQSIFLGDKRLSFANGVGDDSCGQGDCNCGGGCNGECSTSCES